MLYKSGLGFFCVNHVQGCGHGCLYPCYAYMMAHTYGRAKTYCNLPRKMRKFTAQNEKVACFYLL